MAPGMLVPSLPSIGEARNSRGHDLTSAESEVDLNMLDKLIAGIAFGIMAAAMALSLSFIVWYVIVMVTHA